MVRPSIELSRPLERLSSNEVNAEIVVKEPEIANRAIQVSRYATIAETKQHKMVAHATPRLPVAIKIKAGWPFDPVESEDMFVKPC
jgi:hypothetical protein